MISVSQEVIDLINADSRTFRAKFKHGDSVYDKIMSLKWNVCLPSSSFSIGNALSIGIQCTAFDVPVSIKGEELELVITIEGSADEISIGSFTAEKPTIQNGIVSFNAYDDMSKAGNIPYNSTLGEGKHTVNQYLADVAETLGIGYISIGSEGEVTVENDYLSGNSCRNALAYLAGYLGRNCVIKNKKISMKKFTLVDYTMNADRIEEPELEDIDSEIDFIIAQISSNNTIMNGNGATGTELVCPIMTESQLYNVANMLLGADSPVKNYRAGKIKLLLGDPRLELCDVIKLDYKDTEYIIPITSISFEYDGGLMTDLEAYALKEPTLLTPSQRLDFAVQEEVKKVLEQLKNIDGTYFYIRYSPNADGSNMTEEPDDKTEYIGVCSTNQSSAPGEASAYTWSKFKGKDGSSNFFHVKYSNDGGKTFTGTDGETAGEYIGILVDSNEDDSTIPSDYTWSKIVGNDGRGVSKVETEYRLSTSDTRLSSGYTWGTDAPTWQDGLFLWTRLVTYYTDGTNTPSDPVVDASWKKTSVVDEASKELNETLANALGLHVTEYTVGSSKIRYYHSNSSLTNSKSGDTILVFNSNGFGVCTTGWNNGSPQFTYGATFDGKAVWDILTANKISADLIEAGSIKSLPSAKVQTTINLDDGTYTSTAGDTKITIQGGEVDEESGAETTPAGILLDNLSDGSTIRFSVSGIQFMSQEYVKAYTTYAIALALDIVLGTNNAPALKPEDPYFSSVAEKDIKTTNIHCKNIYISVSDGEESLLDALSMLSEQVNLLSESLTALQEKYLVLEEALGQQHEHTASTAVRENVVNATCTTQGSYDEVVYCSSCGVELSRTKKYTSVISHNYVSSVTKQPTCTEQGTRKYTCSVCGSSYTENISATGHTDSNGDGYCDTCGTAVGTFYTITANPNNTNYGTVTGGGSYLSGNTATLTATAKTGYRFVQWSDGNTNATRTVTVTGNKTYTATFEVDETVYFTALITASGASGNDAVRLTKDAAGTQNWNDTNFSVGETLYYYAKAGSGRVIWKVEATQDGEREELQLEDLVADSYLNSDHTEFAYDFFVSSSALGITLEFVVYFKEATSSGDLTISAGETKTVNVAKCTNGGLGSGVLITDFTLVKFVPTVSGTYQFEVTNSERSDTCGRLYDSSKTINLAEDDDAGTGNHFLFTYDCAANTTYYIAVKFYGSSIESGTADLLVTHLSSGGGSTETKNIEIRCGGSAGTTEIKRNGVVVHDSSDVYSDTFNYGEEVTLTANIDASSGYSFSSWLDLETGEILTKNNIYTFTVGSTTPNKIGIGFGVA